MPLPLAKARRGFSPQPEPQPARSSGRSQLEQDVSHRSPLPPPMPTLTHALTWNARAPAQVKRLRKALQEETALHAVLEGALGRAAVTLAEGESIMQVLTLRGSNVIEVRRLSMIPRAPGFSRAPSSFVS